jgi:hypothetical protein
MASSTLNILQDYALSQQLPTSPIFRYHLLEILLARLGRCTELILRGGMLMRLWVGAKRNAQDLDYAADFEWSPATPQQLKDTLLQTLPSPKDKLKIAGLRTQGIWLETAFPGVRAAFQAQLPFYTERVSMDIGFGDPLIPRPVFLQHTTLLGKTISIPAVAPETLFAWKLHGLAERPPAFWRPKDLRDIKLLMERFPVLPALAKAIEAAFTSRGMSLQDLRQLLSRPSWMEAAAEDCWREAFPDEPGPSVLIPKLTAFLSSVL